MNNYPVVDEFTLPSIIEDEVSRAIGHWDGSLSEARANEFNYYYGRAFGNEVEGGVATKDDENYADGRFLDMVQAIIKIDGQHITDGECLEAIMVLTDLWAEIHH